MDRCYNRYGSPVWDTIFAVPAVGLAASGVYVAAAQEDPRGYLGVALGVAATAFFATSAGIGHSRVAACRQARERFEVDPLPDDPPPEIPDTNSCNAPATYNGGDLKGCEIKFGAQCCTYRTDTCEYELCQERQCAPWKQRAWGCN